MLALIKCLEISLSSNFTNGIPCAKTISSINILIVSPSTHSENFTLTLIPKGKSYYVSSLTHTIPQNYATEKGE